MTATTGTHPGWCDPRRCVDTGQDFEHSSATVSETLAGQLVELTLLRLDDHAFPAEPGEARLRVELTDLELTGPGVRFEVPVRSLSRLRELLSTEEHRARFHGSPVVHRAVAS